jgi:hypothetical protein
MTFVNDQFVLMAMGTKKAAITMYTAADPTEPWVTFYQTEDLNLNPPGGIPYGPSSYAFYLPKFHEELNPNSKHLLATYNRNIFTNAGVAGNPALSNMHCKTFVPQFIYLPTPGA